MDAGEAFVREEPRQLRSVVGKLGTLGETETAERVKPTKENARE